MDVYSRLVLFFAGEGAGGDIYMVRSLRASVIERDTHLYQFDYSVATIGEMKWGCGMGGDIQSGQMFGGVNGLIALCW